MSWIDRLKSTIEFTSPKGRRFSAKWAGSNRSKTKKLGIFSQPKRVGTLYQDLDTGAVSYPMTVYFDGDNNDLIAQLFFKTVDERGKWEVIHPVHGKLRLQFVSITEKNQPITDGNYTGVDLEFVESLDEDSLLSSAELADLIEALILQINASAADQLNAVAKKNTVSEIQALKNGLNTIKTGINAGLERVSELNADIARIVNEVQRATTFALLQPDINLSSIAGQIQQLAQLPTLAIDNIVERLNSYNQTGVALISQPTPSEANSESANELAIKELGLVSIATAFPRIVATGNIDTRKQALEFAENLSDFFTDITNSLDEGQKLFEGSTIDIQYFSQSQTYPDLMLLISLGIRQLLDASLDLKIEKRFKLKTDRCPIELAISEYGGTGDNDSNIDFFIETNKLKGKDILLLPQGREVVVYV